ncbi:hypothetical protein TNCV_2577171 [Trichonephila clavipes]|nr:hypothetical protein TNCV_2577171 [Trichonephila clavipes]
MVVIEDEPLNFEPHISGEDENSPNINGITLNPEVFNMPKPFFSDIRTGICDMTKKKWAHGSVKVRHPWARALLREELLYGTMKEQAFYRYQLLRVVVVEGIVIEGMASIQRRYNNFCKQKANHFLLSSLVQIFIGAAILNGLLHSNKYEERRVTRCITGIDDYPSFSVGF